MDRLHQLPNQEKLGALLDDLPPFTALNVLKGLGLAVCDSQEQEQHHCVLDLLIDSPC